MGKCTIRLARQDDSPFIMNFIDEYWKKGHILAKNCDLFNWQYFDENSSIVNMLVALDMNGKIEGILGFIPYDSQSRKDLSLALWKANNDKESFLGIRLFLYLLEKIPHRSIFCPGINIGTSDAIYHRMNIMTDTMRQWYRLRDLPDYKIAGIQSKTIPPYSGTTAELVPYRTFDELLSNFDYDRYVTKEQVPYKSKAYFEKRYYRHPYYQYLVYGIRHDGEIRASIVIRIQECNGARAIRFVDCIGDYSQIACATAGLDSLLEQFDAEYIDMYEAGLPDDMLAEAGWIQLKETNNVVPNYFSPLEQRVVDIHYCTSNPDIVLFRGDGDQDRPN